MKGGLMLECGAEQFDRDCEPEYDMAEIDASAQERYALFTVQASTVFKKKHSLSRLACKAQRDCATVEGGCTGTGGYCLSGTKPARLIKAWQTINFGKKL